VGKKSPFEDAIEQQLPSILPFIGLKIVAVEVTQGIQYCRAAEHLTDPADRGPDNSVPLVAGKLAWVRVYVHSAIGSPISDVTGGLKVYVRELGFLWKQVADLSPEAPGWMTAEWDPDYALERSTLKASLNFKVPADVMCGHLRLDVDVESPAGYKVSTSLHVGATLQQTLSIRIIPVAYDGPDAAGSGTLQIPAPDLADAQSTAGWSLLAYPVSSTPVIDLTASVTLSVPLGGDYSSGCTQGFYQLNNQLAEVKNADGNPPDTIYYGLVPADVPHGLNDGCQTQGVSSGFVDDGIAMAHEIGHLLGFGHVPGCDAPLGLDPNYPAYEPYDPPGTPHGSIGEYGLDSNGSIYSPATYKDLMTYCDPSIRWISLYHHGKSLNNPFLAPTYVCQDEPWWPNGKAYDPFWKFRPPEPPEGLPLAAQQPPHLEPLISIIGIRHPTGELEVQSVTRTVASRSIVGGIRTDLMAELIDETGHWAAAAPVYRFASHWNCGCRDGDDERADRWSFQAFIPDLAVGSALRIVTDGVQTWERRVPTQRPVIESFEAMIRDGRLHVAWQLGKDNDDQEVWLCRVADDSQRPRVIHISRGSGDANLDLGLLPLGNVSLELVVHDGFHITSATINVEVPGRPPTVALFHPRDHQILKAGSTLRLHGIATSADRKPVDPTNCKWFVDSAEVASGIDAWIVAPSPGKHQVALVAEDHFGQGERVVSFRTVVSEFHPSRPEDHSRRS
jgi:hypothetical protein